MSSVGLWNINDYPVNVLNVNCTGQESALLQCQYTIAGSTQCYSNDAIGVFCQKCNNIIYFDF